MRDAFRGAGLERGRASGAGEATTTGRGTHRATRRRRPRLAGRLFAALLAAIVSLSLIGATTGLNAYLTRGVVYGIPTLPMAAPGGGPALGMNVFLEKEVDRGNIVRSVRMLREARVAYVRQSFPWAEIEPVPGQFRDVNSGQDSWAKYDFIVEQLRDAGIGILARIDTIPRWARPPGDNFARYDKGPPQDYNNYANFVATLAARYAGKVGHFQVWNEPNLDGEWGGKPISPEQYGLLLKTTYPKLKAANPAALLVTAGLAQTIEDGIKTNNLNELDFIEGLYASGAGDAFDILSVMAYGLGTSPEDRRVGPERTNFSRLLLVREIMQRNHDEEKPIWVSEYGWISLPEGWSGPPGTWGDSVDEETQARWIVAGLERTRREWPWVGAVFVWGFRWVEPPAQTANEPARHFEVVEHDFTPRPAFVALRDWATREASTATGALGIRDPRLVWEGPWRDQQLAGREYRVAEGAGTGVRLAFQGTELQVQARTGRNAGRMYVTIDDRPVAGLPVDAGGSYLALESSRIADDALPIASGLTDGTHVLHLRAAGDGAVALNGFAVGRRQPFAWVAQTLFVIGLGGLFTGLFLAGKTLLMIFGWLPRAGGTRGGVPMGSGGRQSLPWWNTRE